MIVDGPKRLTLEELEQLEEEAHRSGTTEALDLLRVAAALREALQAKANAEAIADELRRRPKKRRRT